jgi:hypothetical protein
LRTFSMSDRYASLLPEQTHCLYLSAAEALGLERPTMAMRRVAFRAVSHTNIRHFAQCIASISRSQSFYGYTNKGHVSAESPARRQYFRLPFHRFLRIESSGI